MSMRRSILRPVAQKRCQKSRKLSPQDLTTAGNIQVLKDSGQHLHILNCNGVFSFVQQRPEDGEKWVRIMTHCPIGFMGFWPVCGYGVLAFESSQRRSNREPLFNHYQAWIGIDTFQTNYNNNDHFFCLADKALSEVPIRDFLIASSMGRQQALWVRVTYGKNGPKT